MLLSARLYGIWRSERAKRIAGALLTSTEAKEFGAMSSMFRTEIMKPLRAWLVILAVVGVLGAFAVIYSGIFNVAATVEDAAPLRWVLITAREASIRSHAWAIQVPALDSAEQVESGFRLFGQEYAMCHTPPGRPATIMAKGLNPQAPPLAELVDMTDAKLFWVTKNGIRFTSMPPGSHPKRIGIFGMLSRS